MEKTDESIKNDRAFHFSVQGELITRIARERVFYENPPKIKYAIDLLMSCLETDQASEGDRLLLAIKILNGEARIVGTYPGDDYGVEMLENPEKKFNLMDRIERMAQEVEDLKAERRELFDKLACVAEELELSDWKMRAINRTWRTDYGGENDIFDVGPYDDGGADPLLSALKKFSGLEDGEEDPVADFIERMNSDTEDDYGWLAPDGTFYPVEFASHQSWAWRKLKELGAIEKHELNTGSYGDKLVEMGWALLHNPGMGTAFVTSSDAKPLTKKQKDFLFDYYTKRNKHQKAAEYLQ